MVRGLVRDNSATNKYIETGDFNTYESSCVTFLEYLFPICESAKSIMDYYRFGKTDKPYYSSVSLSEQGFNLTKHQDEMALVHPFVISCYGKVTNALEDFKGIHRCSSMIENYNSRIRPYLSEMKSFSQIRLNLIRFYLNHKLYLRAANSDNKGKTPAEILTGKTLENWIELLGFQSFKRNVI